MRTWYVMLVLPECYGAYLNFKMYWRSLDHPAFSNLTSPVCVILRWKEWFWSSSILYQLGVGRRSQGRSCASTSLPLHALPIWQTTNLSLTRPNVVYWCDTVTKTPFVLLLEGLKPLEQKFVRNLLSAHLGLSPSIFLWWYCLLFLLMLFLWDENVDNSATAAWALE